MGLFSLDIERYYQELEVKGQHLKGLFCIQYPIYCIHATITDSTPEALDNLDKVILEFFSRKASFTTFQIACLMGTTKLLVEYRIKRLITDGLLERTGSKHIPTKHGLDLLINGEAKRLHKRSFDFYLDGLTLRPLSRFFYTHYRSKLISEHQEIFRTNQKGETYIIKPFGPDLVHTPPNRSLIIENILNIEPSERSTFSIPPGLVNIDKIAFSKLSFQILVSVSQSNNTLIKELIDGFAIYSLMDNISYYEALKRNVRSFENQIAERIKQLEFKIVIPKQKEDQQEEPSPIITSNWPETDKYTNSSNKCFSFSSEDLVKVVAHHFDITPVLQENIKNEEASIGINITRQMMLEAANKPKLLDALIRKRDYKVFSAVASLDKNVFLIYLTVETNDPFVIGLINFRLAINEINRRDINLSTISTILKQYESNYRQLFTSAGEYELLERLDVEKHMISFR